MLLSSPCLDVDLELDQLSLFGVVDLVAYAESRGIGLELKTAHLSMQSRVRNFHIETAPTELDPTPSVAPPSVGICRAESLGILRLEHPSRNGQLACVGHAVTVGDPVALLQVGVRYSVVRAHCNGTIQRWLVAPGTLVGYGDPLMELLPEVSV